MMQRASCHRTNVKLKSVKRRLRDVLLCLALAKEDNELLEMLQRLEAEVVTETLLVDPSSQEDSDEVDKNFIAFVKGMNTAVDKLRYLSQSAPLEKQLSLIHI